MAFWRQIMSAKASQLMFSVRGWRAGGWWRQRMVMAANTGGSGWSKMALAAAAAAPYQSRSG